MRYRIQRAIEMALTLLALLFAWSNGPMLYHAFTLGGDLDLYAMDAATAQLSESRIRDFLMKELDRRGLEPDPKTVRVSVLPAERTVRVSMTYFAPVDLFFTKVRLDFHARSERHALPTKDDIKNATIPLQ